MYVCIFVVNSLSIYKDIVIVICIFTFCIHDYLVKRKNVKAVVDTGLKKRKPLTTSKSPSVKRKLGIVDLFHFILYFGVI